MTQAFAFRADEQSKTGIVWAYRFAADGRAEIVPREEIPTLPPEQGFVWIHLDLVHNRAKSWIGEQSRLLSPTAEEVFLSGETHQRLDHSAGLVWGVAHDLIRDVDRNSGEVGALYWIVTDRFVITGRREAMRSTRLVAETLDRGESVASTADLFELLFELIIDDVTDAVVLLMDQTDSVEDLVLSDGFEDAPSRIGAIRRTAVRLHRQLAGLHLLLRRFADGNSGRGAPDAMRACASRLLQGIEGPHTDVQSVQDRARLLQDEMAARNASQTNRQLYALSLLTALFLPATFITGLFGINVKGLPWVEADLGAGFVALACLGAALLTLLLLRRRGVIGG
ncbi:MAG TPA: CorA family divalent cation transporter [Bosea sp. (in: a-proteobacteria)]|jgi:Mg2+ and Co2+ transporter CorA|uniref:CorA family divalent cation transporter n=1 Tax=Bosea sp. (in: a-proteobacteria) TaxID=1871050 RepID=UPI002E15DAFA|nr:CorA family divalent cation transporter [Bosea sp. (in: a-proteobacteria)]